LFAGLCRQKSILLGKSRLESLDLLFKGRLLIVKKLRNCPPVNDLYLEPLVPEHLAGPRMQSDPTANVVSDDCANSLMFRDQLSCLSICQLGKSK
jgi:hypothetical protein